MGVTCCLVPPFPFCGAYPGKGKGIDASADARSARSTRLIISDSDELMPRQKPVARDVIALAVLSVPDFRFIERPPRNRIFFPIINHSPSAATCIPTTPDRPTVCLPRLHRGEIGNRPVRKESTRNSVQMASESENGNCNAWAARDPSGVLSPCSFDRRAVQNSDVALKIIYCGVCYADVAWTRNKMNDSKYPLVPGHEIAGVVTQVGADVKGFKVGDHVGVGTYVNSCRDCENCNSSMENHCPKGVYTFNGIDTDGTVTKGGYSTHIVVHERYCFKIPDGYPLAEAAPLLCAGITVYTPMMRHNMNQPGKSLGVIGLGGLGHMAVKFGKAFGLKVTVFSTSESKRDEAINLLGADNFVISSDTQQMESLKNSLHFIVDTASGDHPVDPYLSLLKVGGVMTLVGFPSEIKMHPASLILGARTLSGSVVGGTKDIQEMVNFCAANNIYPEIEIIKIDYINEALTRLVNRDVKYRFVIDIENSFK